MDAWSEQKIFTKLKSKYDPQEWVLLPQVRTSTGGYVQRTADAIALNCWKSRGLVLHGFEFKSARSDWVRELKNPQKAEEGIYRYCDRWWLVTGHKDVARREEIPETWGYARPHGQGLKIIRKAPKLEPVDLDRGFVASVMRNLRDKGGLPDEVLQARYAEGHADGYQKGLTQQQQVAERWRNAHDNLQKLHRQFEAESGLRISNYTMGNIGEVIRLLQQSNPTTILERAVTAWEHQERMVKDHLSRLRVALSEASELDKKAAALRKGKKKVRRG